MGSSAKRKRAGFERVTTATSIPSSSATLSNPVVYNPALFARLPRFYAPENSPWSSVSHTHGSYMQRIGSTAGVEIETSGEIQISVVLSIRIRRERFREEAVKRTKDLTWKALSPFNEVKDMSTLYVSSRLYNCKTNCQE